MPELAEVEYYRKRWSPGLGQTVREVCLHARAKVYRGTDTAALAGLVGQRLESSAAAAKQMLFRFSGGWSLGVHLGMSGLLRSDLVDTKPGRHDHLLLRLDGVALVFTDPRMFGRVLLHTGPGEPDWWTSLPPPLLSSEFTTEAMADYLRRHARAPLKASLLDQSRFPGIGNWMADEILWRASLHPAQPGGSLKPAQLRRLFREIQWVAREALATIGETMEDPPATWLFPHRWADGGGCPRSGGPLRRATIGGRTTCWSPRRQGEEPKA